MDYAEADEIIKRYGNKESSILPILQDIQAKERYLPKEIMEYVAKRMQIPATRIFRIATFYNALSIKPRGRHRIQVCLGTACHVRGGNMLLDKLKMDLGIDVDETTRDKRFTLEAVRCVGCCSLGPVAVIDGNVYGRLTRDKLPQLLRQYK